MRDDFSEALTLPRPDEVRKQLDRNLRERQFLRRLLKLAIDREAAEMKGGRADG